MLRIGIVGTGVMGAGHARFIRDSVDGAEVSALFDVDQNKVNQLADELKTVTLRTSNVEDLMNSNEVDAIIIASPDNFHVQHLRLAILSKKPTLCEKPLATNLDEARAVASEIKEYEKACGKRMIHSGFMRRFDDAYRKARDLINSGNYGSPLYCRTTARNVSSTGVTTSGLYTNIAVHDFDILRWLFKDEWVSVTSNYPKRSSLSPEGLNDPLVVIAKMKNGLMMVADIFAFNNYGSPLYCRTTARNVSSTGVTTSGLYTNIAVHDFDILRWLFKDEWVSVTSNYPKRSSLSPEGLNDPLVVIAKMKNGLMMVADIFAFNNYGYDVRTEVICEKGSIEIGIHGDVITRSNRVAGVGKGGEMDENWIPRFNDSYIAELRAWVETITTGKENSDLATVEDALAANEVCALGVASI